MTRPNFRRTLRLESLESRELLASGGPSAQQQYMLELLNLARTNPATIADRVTTNLDADVQATVQHYNVDLNQVRSAIASAPVKPPLAWNSQLASAAQDHSQDQANTGVQSHSGSDGSNLGTRLDRTGYTNRTSSAENAFAYSKSVDEAMEAFLIDWGVGNAGHRNTILEPSTSQEDSYRDVGVGIVNTKTPSPVGPIVITQNFGSQANAKPKLLGVAYNDPNHKNFYQPGQGRGDVTVDAVNEATGEKSSVQTWDSGGYQIPLNPGNYKVTASVGGQVVRSQEVKVNDVNVKVDYDLSDPWQGGTVAALTTPPSAPPATPPVATPPKVALQTLSAPTEAPKPVAPPKTDSANHQESNSASTTTVQAETRSDHEAVAPPNAEDSDFSTNWVSWKAKKSA